MTDPFTPLELNESLAAKIVDGVQTASKHISEGIETGRRLACRSIC
jgi:hypothetical protein